MKFTTTLAITAIMSLSLVSNASAEGKIDNKQAWLTNAVAQIQAGKFSELETKVKTTLGDTMHEDVDDFNQCYGRS